MQANENVGAVASKKANWFIRLWDYFTMYEKIWLTSLIEIGLLVAIFFPSGDQPLAVMILEAVVLIGGCSCELLLSKQSKWAFIVSFFLYDLAQTVVYFSNGYYISALFEIIFWMPILFVSFWLWDKRKDKEDKNLTKVRAINIKRDILIFLGVCALSFGIGALFTTIGFFSEGLSEHWYLDALANTFSVCNGLFLLLCYREQWFFWIGVALTESIMWILAGEYILLILQVGYLMNSTYGLIRWTMYTRKQRRLEAEGLAEADTELIPHTTKTE